MALVFPMSRSCLKIRIWWRSWRRRRVGTTVGGALGSLVLHGVVVLLLISGLFDRDPIPPPIESPLPVELVEAGEKTSPATGLAPTADQPQMLRQSADPSPKKDQPTPVSPSLSLRAKPERANPATPSKPAPPKEPQRPDDFTAMLKSLSVQRQPSASRSRSAAREAPEQYGGAANNDDSAPGRRGTLAVKDFIRAQIERHWEFDMAALGASTVVVSLHLLLRTDGGVVAAEIIDDPRYSGVPNYRAMAESVRRAALVASPLQLPSGMMALDTSRDLTLSFNPRDAVR